MPWVPNYKKGVDAPVWDWLSMAPVTSNPGTANAYDGVRYIYWLIQSGSTTAGTASTTQLYRFDTWNDGWQFLATAISGSQGLDVEYDSIRNVVYIINGALLTSWQVFNLNTTAVTISGVVCNPWVLTTMTPILPATAGTSASITLPDDSTVSDPIDSGTAATGSIATILFETGDPTFGPGLVGLRVRFTAGTLSGQARTIVSVQSSNQLTVAPGFTGAPTIGDAWVIEQEAGTASAGITTTLTDSSKAWVVNQYSNMDVIITGGTGSGQRRRLASNTATVLTLAGAQAGNARTGPFSTAPDATSTYKIVPSSDFLYFQPGSTSAVLYKIDVATGATVPSWVTLASAPATPGGGANTVFPQNFAPYYLMMLRGGATANVYQYSVGLNTWATITTFMGVETFTTGASMVMLHGKRRMFIQKEASTRLYVLNLVTGILEPFGTMPYSNPGSQDGHRARYVKTSDGVEWLYLQRAGGSEFFRVALEWFS